MEVYRITQKKYAKKLLASGAPNRWNKENEYVIYTSENKSLCVLELLAHRNSKMKNANYNLLKIFIPSGKANVEEIENNLPANWKGIKYYNILQNLGSKWYKNKSKLILKVPSVLMPGEYNFVINTNHPNFKKVKILSNVPFAWDSRIKNLLK